MSRYGFPADDYTPHGYLANPHAVAHSWSDGEGGCLRSSRTHLGVGWQLPWALQAKASADLVVALECRGERIVSRADFSACDVFSPHHSATLLTLRWQAFGRTWDASYVQVDADRLGLELVSSALPGEPDGPVSDPVVLTVGVVGWRQPGGDSPAPAVRRDGLLSLGEPFGGWRLDVGDALVTTADGRILLQHPETDEDAGWLTLGLTDRAAAAASVLLPPGDSIVRASAARVALQADANAPAFDPSDIVQAVARARRADDRFWSKAARLVGDWPHHWRRGWVYDIETTRMCMIPAGGVFTDVWPAWMIQWPRAVVAEGTLDVARLAYADPALALRAALSLFRDTTADNIPCIFQYGEPNMVAADGGVCGTSPAWCVPFYNLELLYRRTLDRAWLAAIYPHLARYLSWWLRERTDADGWAVYKCTWEAGEDDTPRLDPERRGDNVVSEYVRPVELQATKALSAGVLARFASALGQSDEVARWERVQSDFAERTGQLWDDEAGRFRDWDRRRAGFLQPASAGETNYWGIDPCRYSALAFTPVLAGLATGAQARALGRELEAYGGPPWTLWASWSYVVLEAACQLSQSAWAGTIAAGIVDRVYRELDARQIDAPSHPTPGVAREYWPLDLDTWASCEGYGWGANTATLLMRQIVGFREGPLETDPTPGAPGWRAPVLRFSLAPQLPDDLLVPGAVYKVVNLPYRGAQLSIGYRVERAATDAEPAQLTALVAAEAPTSCAAVVNATAVAVPARPVPVVAAEHTWPLRNGEAISITLQPVPAG
ncbi:MAG: hypothetical protein IT306_03840 [Chloroflexi bacterium]|nr:hypothetical protein [Chloroflexota bacterium]